MASPEDSRWRKDQDHDLLLNLDSKVNTLITIFEKNYQEKKERLDDHEQRIRFMEKSVWLGMGGLAILQVLIKVIWK